MATASTAHIAERTRLPHMPQLDSLRALAVAAVVFNHLTPGGWRYGAAAGVRLFFTLSGFLITGILLGASDDVAAGIQTRGHALGHFYARRFLRIVPLYYFVVAIALTLNLEPTRQIVVWLLTYTLNIRIAHQGWYEAHVAHFWSLCVEEQFYLLWPGLLLYSKRRWLKVLIPVVTAAGPLYRASYVLSGYTNMKSLSTYISTITNLDALGVGSLAALLWSALDKSQYRTTLAGIAAVSAAATLYLALKRAAPVGIIFHDTAQAILFGCLIVAAARGSQDLSAGCLNGAHFFTLARSATEYMSITRSFRNW